MPLTADTLVKATARDRRKMEMLALGVQAYAELLNAILKGGSIDDIADPQLRKLALNRISIKQSDRKRTKERRPDA